MDQLLVPWKYCYDMLRLPSWYYTCHCSSHASELNKDIEEITANLQPISSYIAPSPLCATPT